MENALFRKQAVTFQQQQHTGQALVLPSVPLRMICLLLVGLLILTFWYLVNQQYRELTRVPGWLVSKQGSVSVLPGAGEGRVTEVLVREGQRVKAGQPLLVVRSGRALESGQGVHDLMAQEYVSQTTLLEKQLASQHKTQQIEAKKLETVISTVREDAKRLTRVISVIDQRLSLAEEKANAAAQLSRRKLIAPTEVAGLTRDVLALTQEKLERERELANLHAKETESMQSLKGLPALNEKDNSALEAQISTLRNQILQLDSQHQTVITASRKGIVTNLQAITGQFLNGRQPLMSIVPETTVLHGKLTLPVQSAGFLKEGQKVVMKYDAFPYQKFGIQIGRVAQISRSILLPEEVQRLPVKLSSPAYLVDVTIDSQFVDAYGKPVALKTGMTFSAEIATSEYTLMEWIFRPLLSLQGVW